MTAVLVSERRIPVFAAHQRLAFASQTPRLWSGGDFKYRKDDEVEYTEHHVKKWKSWMGSDYEKYKEDELIAWRRPFDELSKGGLINVNSFMKIVKNKVGRTVPPKSLHTYAMKLWREWDEDQSNFIDFAEFIHNMKNFDTHVLKTALREESKAADTFETYKNPDSGQLDEDGMFEIMAANNFLVTTTTDAEVLRPTVRALASLLFDTQEILAQSVLAMRRRSRALHAALVGRLSVDGPTLISRVLDCLGLALFDELWAASVECWITAKEIEARKLPKGSGQGEEPVLSVAARFPSIGERLLARQSTVLEDFRITEKSLQQAEEWWKGEALESNGNAAAQAVVKKFDVIAQMLELEPDRLVEAPECLRDQARAEYPEAKAVRDALRKYRDNLPNLKGLDTDSPPNLEDLRTLLERKQGPLPMTLRARTSELVNHGDKAMGDELRKLFVDSVTPSLVHRRL
ncbi:hypothetical protein FOZ62_024836 [Perkinsus olseni]|uniref:EF-hand domain-containing protein n=1 Tax=Perkinsus olseni TaxID=32597 RepID=A0A7J6T7T7_PEROL|nr:hypothetical protein FOZ62_024836 [Perkinsus olseni]